MINWTQVDGLRAPGLSIDYMFAIFIILRKTLKILKHLVWYVWTSWKVVTDSSPECQGHTCLLKLGKIIVKPGRLETWVRTVMLYLCTSGGKRDYLGIFPNSQNYSYPKDSPENHLNHLKIIQNFPTWLNKMVKKGYKSPKGGESINKKHCIAL